MITIFNGRSIGTKEGEENPKYAQVSVELRDNMHLFAQGERSLNSFAVLMCIALHADKNGWAFPSKPKLKKETGLKTDEAVSRSINHLRNMEIGGHPVLHHYREVLDSGNWGKSFYHVFPDCGGAEQPPSQYIHGQLVRWDVQKKPPKSRKKKGD